jgi:hypothetical protein
MKIAKVFEKVYVTISVNGVHSVLDPLRYLLKAYFMFTSHLQLVCLHSFSLTFYMHLSLLP